MVNEKRCSKLAQGYQSVISHTICNLILPFTISYNAQEPVIYMTLIMESKHTQNDLSIT